MNAHNEASLQILFWNTRSFLRRREEVELWLTSSTKNLHFSGFLTFRKYRTHSTGGDILLLICRSIAYTELIDINSPNRTVEICGMQITNTTPCFNLIVCYRTPNHNLSLEQWGEILSNIDVSQHNIVVGDFNAHNTVWNCTKTDSNGEKLLDCIEKHQLFIHNSESYSHIDNYVTHVVNYEHCS